MVRVLSEETCSFRRILADQFARRPRQEMQDLYKLVHQTALGSEHAVKDSRAVEKWLERELAEMGPGLPEPLVETLSPDGRLVRVNLRPYVAAGGDARMLLAAFIQTASQARGATETLRRYWDCAEQMAHAGELPFSVEALRRFIKPLEAQGYPAVHHSETYRAAYHPAYRVIARGLLEQALPRTEL